MRYANPGGFDFGRENLDGYGISLIIVNVIYSIGFYSACVYVWSLRQHPILQKRNVLLVLLSLLNLHIYGFMAMMFYILNGAFPCSVEYWDMNLYLPIGIGLFQAQNQQLLIVSQKQAQLMVSDELYKPMVTKTARGVGGPRYWLLRLKVSWRNIGPQGKYQAFIYAGIVVQFFVSFIIYNISQKFNHYGIVGHHTDLAQCRRGWEWAPSVVWQFMWNYFFGPYLIWKIRMVHDIYHWRLQTIISVVAGIPATPIWLASLYSDSFGKVNKYWLPGVWFVPGIYTMEVVTLGFPIYQIFKYRKAARETRLVLQEFDQKQLQSSDMTLASTSLRTRSTRSSVSKRMYPMDSLDKCLASDYNGLQIYASCMELNGENIIFLTKVLAFAKTCKELFASNCKCPTQFSQARTKMFRVALSIFISLVHTGTASYPINIESFIYLRLDAIFAEATELVAGVRMSRTGSVATSGSSNITPWEDQAPADDSSSSSEHQFPMHAMASDGQSTPSSNIKKNESSEHIVKVDVADLEGHATKITDGSLQVLTIPDHFDEKVFDAAFKSVRYMVWTETWQRYMAWKTTSSTSSVNELG